MAEENYLLKYDIDYSRAIASSQEFVNKVERDVASLVARVQQSGSGVGAVSFARELAAMQDAIRRLKTEASGRGVTLPSRPEEAIQNALRTTIPSDYSKGPIGAGRAAGAMGVAFQKELTRLQNEQTATVRQINNTLGAQADAQEEARNAVEARIAALKATAAFERQLAVNSEENATLAAEAAVLTKQRNALERRMIEKQLRADSQFIENTAAGDTAKAEREAAQRRIVQQNLAADSPSGRQYRDDQANANAAEKQRKYAVDQQTKTLLGAGFEVNKERDALQRRAELAQEAISRYQQEANIDEDVIRLKARVQAIEAQRAQLEQKAYIEELNRYGKIYKGPGADAVDRFRNPGNVLNPNASNAVAYNPNLAPPTRFQQLQASIAARAGTGIGRGPQSFATGGQFLGQKLLSAGGYAVSGGLLYGAQAGIRAIIDNAEELEQQMNRIESTFDALGQGAGFQDFKNGILEISRNTGIASSITADMARQLKGAFGDQGNDVVLKNTEAAAQLLQVTNLSAQEIVDGVTAASKTLGVDFAALGDKAVGVEQRYGVNAQETLAFIGDLSVSAQEAGLDLGELSSIAGVALQRSGRGGAALAEAFGRVLPLVQQSSIEIIRLFEEAGAGEDVLASLRKSAGEGQSGQTLLTAVRNIEGDKNGVGALNKQQNNEFINLLGGARQAFAVTALVQGVKDLNKELDLTDNHDAGKLEERFGLALGTLNVKLEQLSEAFRQAGQELYDAGLDTLLKSSVDLATLFLSAVQQILGLFGKLDGATGGWAVRLGTAYATIKAISLLSKISLVQSALGSLTGAIGVGGKGAALGTGAGTGFGSMVPGLGAQAASTGLLSRLLGGGAAAGGTALLGGAGPQIIGVAALAAGTFAYQKYQEKKAKEQKEEKDYYDKIINLPTAEFRAERRDRKGDEKAMSAFEDATRQRAIKREALPERIDFLKNADLKNAAKNGTFDYDAAIAAYEKTAGKGRRGQNTISRRDLERQLMDPNETILGERKWDGNFLDSITGGLEGNSKEAKALAESILIGLGKGTAEQYKAGLESERLDAIAAASADGTYGNNIDALKSAYEAGEVTATAYKNALKKLIEDNKKVGNAGKGDDKFAKDAADTAKLYNEFTSNQLLKALEFQVANDALTTGDDPNHARDLYTSFLSNPEVKDPKARYSAAQEIIKLTQEALDQYADEAVDDVDKVARLLAGLPIPAEAQKAVLVERLTAIDPLWQDFINTNITGMLDAAGFVGMVADQAIKDGIGVVDAGRAVLVQNIENLKLAVAATIAAGVGGDGVGERLDAANKALAAFDAMKASLSNFTSTGRVTDQAGAREAKAKDEDTAAEIAQAQFNLEKARLDPDDSLGRAKIDLAAARRAEADAKGTVAKLNAQAQVVEAQRAVVDAQREVATRAYDLFTSSQNVLIALAEAAGDSVLAAREGVKAAQERVNRLPELTQGMSADEAQKTRNEAQIALITANQTATDAEIQAKQDEINYGLTMEAISKGQAVALAQTMLTIPNLNEDQKRDINMYIKQLQDDASADFALNLPTTFGLPTLYEGRRLGQTGGDYSSRQSYVDNRVISITVPDAGDPSATAQAVAMVLSEAPRQGIAPKAY